MGRQVFEFEIESGKGCHVGRQVFEFEIERGTGMVSKKGIEKVFGRRLGWCRRRRLRGRLRRRLRWIQGRGRGGCTEVESLGVSMTLKFVFNHSIGKKKVRVKFGAHSPKQGVVKSPIKEGG